MEQFDKSGRHQIPFFQQHGAVLQRQLFQTDDCDNHFDEDGEVLIEADDGSGTP